VVKYAINNQETLALHNFSGWTTFFWLDMFAKKLDTFFGAPFISMVKKKILYSTDSMGLTKSMGGPLLAPKKK